MVDPIQNEQLKKFVESTISNDFGLTVQQVAENCRTYGRFSAWLNGDIDLITQVLTIVQNNGVSPAYFASYEATEGYNSSWGWLNHTTPQGTPTQDAQFVAQKLVTTSHDRGQNPSWIDYGHPVDFVPQSIKTSGNTHFSGMASGTVGRSFIPLTAAATWEVYYPNGLKKEYNQVQDYGAPLTHSMQLIIQWGGVIDGVGGGGKPVYPTLSHLPITSRYGFRGDIGVPGASEYHWAIDIGGNGQLDNPIYATQSGVVTSVGEWADGNNYIFIQHTGDPYWSRYIHLARQSQLVSAGDTVAKGQRIATMGTTGVSSGIHLDFAISINGTFGTEQDTIDPEVYLQMTFEEGESDTNDVTLLLLLDTLAGWKW